MKNTLKVKNRKGSLLKDRNQSSIQRNLNQYMYMPKRSTAKKIKYYYGPYNQYDCMKKYDPVPITPDEDDPNTHSHLWGKLTSFILEEMDTSISISQFGNKKRKNFIKRSNQTKENMASPKVSISVKPEEKSKTQPLKLNLIRSPVVKRRFPKYFEGFSTELTNTTASKNIGPTSKKKESPSWMGSPVLNKRELNKYLPTKFLPMSPVIERRKLKFEKLDKSDFTKFSKYSQISQESQDLGPLGTQNQKPEILDIFYQGKNQSYEGRTRACNSSWDVVRNISLPRVLERSTIKAETPQISKNTKACRKNSENDKLKLLYTSFGYSHQKGFKIRKQMIQKAHKRYSSLDF